MRKYIAVFVIALSVVCVECIISEASEINPDDMIKIGVMEFSSGTMDLISEQAAAVGDIFIRRLAMYAPINITIIGYGRLKQIAEYNHMTTEGYISNRNAVKIGRVAGCKYIITGTVTELTAKKSSTGFNFIVKFGRKVETASVAADIQVMDTETGEAVLSLSDITRINKKDNTLKLSVSDAVLSLSGTSVLGGKNSDSGGNDSKTNAIEAAALYILSSKLSLKVIEKITGIYPKVSKVSQKEITLNTGIDEGSRLGMLYRVYRKSSADKEQDIAIVKVTEVKSDYSKAVLYGKGYGDLSLVRTGDKVFPADTYEAKALLKAKALAQKKAKTSSGTVGTDKEKASAKSKKTSTMKSKRKSKNEEEN